MTAITPEAHIFEAELIDPIEERGQLIAIVTNHLRRDLVSKASAGAALAAIRDRLLYKPEHPTFEAFILAEWGGDISVSSANRWIKADKVLQSLRNSFDRGSVDFAEFGEIYRSDPNLILPGTESHIEQLANLPEEARGPVWVELLKSGKRITALEINDAAREWLESHAPAGALPARAKQQKLTAGAEEEPRRKSEAESAPEPAEDHEPETAPDEDATAPETVQSEAAEIVQQVSLEPIAPEVETIQFAKIREMSKVAEADKFALALLDERQMKDGKTSLVFDTLSTSMVKTGRIALYCSPVSAYRLASDAEAFGWNIEHSIAIQTEITDTIGPFGGIGHRTILVLQLMTGPATETTSVGTVWPIGCPHTHWIVSAFAKRGDRVFVPHRQPEFIGAVTVAAAKPVCLKAGG